MALQKNEDHWGVGFNYWKILRIEPDYATDYTTAVVALYKDEDARLESVGNILKTITVQASGMYETRVEMYPRCKAEGEYLYGAIDC